MKSLPYVCLVFALAACSKPAETPAQADPAPAAAPATTPAPTTQAPPCRDGKAECEPWERAWKDGEAPEKGAVVTTDGTVHPPAPVKLTEADEGRICRAAIAAINGRQPDIIKVVKRSGEIIRTRYTRDDGKVWTNECRVSGDKVEWRTFDVDGPGTGPGRWRDEDDVRFVVSGQSITITQHMDGDFVGKETFTVR